MLRGLFTVVALLVSLGLAQVAVGADLPAKRARSGVPGVIVINAPDQMTKVAPKVAAVENPAPEIREMDLSMVLDSLVATADGIRKEGSASLQTNLVVIEPGFLKGPYMVIELTGHIVKTAGSTARIDVKVGSAAHSVTWKHDDVQEGTFKVTLNSILTDEKLPEYFPVSALAFVTNTGNSGAVMVSLERIQVRLGSFHVADNQ